MLKNEAYNYPLHLIRVRTVPCKVMKYKTVTKNSVNSCDFQQNSKG